jgi:signal transduction histidine kinase
MDLIPLLNPIEITELLLVAIGAITCSSLVLAQNRRVPVSWFNAPLSAWAVAWSSWFALTFLTLNLDLLELHQGTVLRTTLNVVKGWLLCFQMGFFVHGILRLGWRSFPGWLAYPLPAAMVTWGTIRLYLRHDISFLQAIDPIVVLFLCGDFVSLVIAWFLLRRLRRDLPTLAMAILRPMQFLLPLSAFLMGLSIYAKIQQGPWVAREYLWVLPLDLAHLLLPLSILVMAWKTRSVTIEVTNLTWKRAMVAGVLFPVWLGVKLWWPLSPLDWILSCCGLLWALLGTVVPVWRPFFETASRWANYGMERERDALVRLEARLLETRLPRQEYIAFTARALSRLLGCPVLRLAAQDPRLEALRPQIEAASQAVFPALLTMRELTTRREYAAFEELGAQVLVLIPDPAQRPALACVLALGAGRGTRGYPLGLRTRLRALQGAVIQGLEARHFVELRLHEERGRSEQERLAMLGLLSASTAHEIRNPLSAIRNIVTVARREAGEGTTLARDLQVVASEVDRLDATVRRMLDFARDRGTTEDVEATVESVCGLLRLEARETGRPLETRLTGQRFSVAMPESDFKAVLLNLVLNALKHGQGAVQVAVHSHPLRVEVCNAGAISAADLQRLFVPLQSREGIGLGLWTSKARLQENGADLECESSEGRICFRMVWRTA